MFKAPFSFEGRIRRIEYLLSAILGGIVTSIAFWLGVGTAVFGAASNSGGGFGFGVLIGIAALIGGIWFMIAQDVKRLHDVDKSGWLLLLGLIPLVNIVLGLYMLFADGTVGPNRYGTDPKNRMPYYQQPTAVNVTVNMNGDKQEIKQTPSQTPTDTF